MLKKIPNWKQLAHALRARCEAIYRCAQDAEGPPNLIAAIYRTGQRTKSAKQKISGQSPLSQSQLWRCE